MSLFGLSHLEKQEFELIEKLVGIVDRLTFQELERERRKPKAHHLKAVYAIVTDSADIQLVYLNKTKINMPQTITVLDGQNTVPGQLVPLAADNVTVEPISTINAGSELYTSSDTTIATVAADPSGVEGAFIVSRVPGANGNATISYTATTPQGTTISGSDNFVFQGPSTGVATSLTATYGTPS